MHYTQQYPSQVPPSLYSACQQILNSHIYVEIHPFKYCLNQYQKYYEQSTKQSKIAFNVNSFIQYYININKQDVLAQIDKDLNSFAYTRWYLLNRIINIIINFCEFMKSKNIQVILVYYSQSSYIDMNGVQQTIKFVTKLIHRVKNPTKIKIFQKFQLEKLYQLLISDFQQSQIWKMPLKQLCQFFKTLRLDSLAVSKDPCSAQLAYLAENGHMILTWNLETINILPQGVYAINVPIQKLLNTFWTILVQKYEGLDPPESLQTEMSDENHMNARTFQQFQKNARVILYTKKSQNLMARNARNIKVHGNMQEYYIQHFITMVYYKVVGIEYKSKGQTIFCNHNMQSLAKIQNMDISIIGNQTIQQIIIIFLIWQLYPVRTNENNYIDLWDTYQHPFKYIELRKMNGMLIQYRIIQQVSWQQNQYYLPKQMLYIPKIFQKTLKKIFYQQQQITLVKEMGNWYQYKINKQIQQNTVSTRATTTSTTSRSKYPSNPSKDHKIQSNIINNNIKRQLKFGQNQSSDIQEDASEKQQHVNSQAASKTDKLRKKY